MHSRLSFCFFLVAFLYEGAIIDNMQVSVFLSGAAALRCRCRLTAANPLVQHPNDRRHYVSVNQQALLRHQSMSRYPSEVTRTLPYATTRECKHGITSLARMSIRDDLIACRDPYTWHWDLARALAWPYATWPGPNHSVRNLTPRQHIFAQGVAARPERLLAGVPVTRYGSTGRNSAQGAQASLPVHYDLAALRSNTSMC